MWMFGWISSPFVKVAYFPLFFVCVNPVWVYFIGMNMGKSVISFCVLSVLVLPASANAQHHETFAGRSGKRVEEVNKARIRAKQEREAARTWAQQRGMPMRFDDGRRAIELVALRGGHPIYLTTRNDDAAISSAADQVRDSAPFQVSGTGLKVGVWDGGSIRSTHQEFGSRVVIADGSSYGNDATHVGGTLGASGVVAQAQGMVPNVQIDSYDWTDDIAEMLAAGAAAPLETNTIHISNHSYGTIGGWTYMPAGAWSQHTGWHWAPWLTWGAGELDFYFGQYDVGATNYDHVVYQAPYYLPFVAVGNDRSDNPSPGATV
jgi:hypothetical protein